MSTGNQSELESRIEANPGSFFAGVIDVQHRLAKLVGMFPSELGTSAQKALKAENHGAVAFLDVPPGSRGIRAG